MKKTTKKLKLNRETLRSLTPSNLRDAGGGAQTGANCNTAACPTATCATHCFPGCWLSQNGCPTGGTACCQTAAGTACC